MKYQIENQGSKVILEQNSEGFSTGEGKKFSPEIHGNERETILIGLNQQVHEVRLVSISEDGRSMEARINGKSVSLNLKTETDILLEKMGMGNATAAGSGKVKAPMPGLIVKILVQPGDEVEKGQVLLNFEAMKMENQLKSPASGVVKELKVVVGDKVEKGQLLADIG
jgi:biotin carboxyl carrier protein